MADKGQFEAYVLAWSGRADPDGNIYSFDACKQPLNYAGYCKPEVDELLNQSRTPRDPAERKKVYDQIAAIVLKDRPIVYLYHRHWLWAYTSKLSAAHRSPMGWSACRAEAQLPRRAIAADCHRRATTARCSTFLDPQRLATIVPTLFFVSMLIFGLQQLLPGDPAMILAGEEQRPDRHRVPAQKLHLDEPLPVRYALLGRRRAARRPRRVAAHAEAGARR